QFPRAPSGKTLGLARHDLAPRLRTRRLGGLGKIFFQQRFRVVRQGRGYTTAVRARFLSGFATFAAGTDFIGGTAGAVGNSDLTGAGASGRLAFAVAQLQSRRAAALAIARTVAFLVTGADGNLIVRALAAIALHRAVVAFRQRRSVRAETNRSIADLFASRSDRAHALPTSGVAGAIAHEHRSRAYADI